MSALIEEGQGKIRHGPNDAPHGLIPLGEVRTNTTPRARSHGVQLRAVPGALRETNLQRRAIRCTALPREPRTSLAQLESNGPMRPQARRTGNYRQQGGAAQALDFGTLRPLKPFICSYCQKSAVPTPNRLYHSRPERRGMRKTGPIVMKFGCVFRERVMTIVSGKVRNSVTEIADDIRARAPRLPLTREAPTSSPVRGPPTRGAETSPGKAQDNPILSHRVTHPETECRASLPQAQLEPRGYHHKSREERIKIESP